MPKVSRGGSTYAWIKLVRDHGPSNRGARSVLWVLADHADKSGLCWPKVDKIAKESGLQIRQARRWLAWLAEDGWIAREVRGGRKIPNRYTLQRDRFDREAAKENPVTRDPVSTDQKPRHKPVTGDRVSEPETRSPTTQKPGHPRPPQIRTPREPPSSSRRPGAPGTPSDAPRRGVDDDEAKRALAGLTDVFATNAIRAALAAAIQDRGHTPGSINDYLLRTSNGAARNPGAVVLANLRSIPRYESKPEPFTLPPWCGQCDSAGYRFTEDADGRVKPCPRCSPQAVTRASSPDEPGDDEDWPGNLLESP